MRTFLLLLALLLSAPAAAQWARVPGTVYTSGTFTISPHGATGCPATSCVAGTISTANDGTVCVCDDGNTWVELGTGADLQAHLEDAVAAHAATAISFNPAGLTYIGADTAQGAIEDVDLQLGNIDTKADGAQADIDAHEVLAAGAHAASAVAVDPSGLTYVTDPTTIEAQTAVEQLDAGIVSVAGDLFDHATNISNPHSVTAAQLGAVTTSALAATTPTPGASLAGVDSATIERSASGTVQGTLEDFDNDLAMMVGDHAQYATDIETAQQAADAAQADIDAHLIDTSNPHSVTAAQAGAFPLSAFAGDGYWPKATGVETYAMETAAQTRSSLGLATRSEYIAPGQGGMGTLSNMTATDPKWDAANRLPCVTFTASGDSATGGIGWSMILPAQFTAWGPASVLSVGLQFSDDTGNNAASLTCKGTDGAPALDAVSLTPSTSFGWVAVSAASLEVGEAHAAGGIFSCFLSLTSDTADTIQFCGALPTWTH